MNSNKIREGMGFIDEDLIAGAIEYTRTMKKQKVKTSRFLLPEIPSQKSLYDMIFESAGMMMLGF